MNDRTTSATNVSGLHFRITGNQQQTTCFDPSGGYSQVETGQMADIQGIDPRAQTYSIVLTCDAPGASITAECCRPNQTGYKERSEGYRAWAQNVKARLLEAGFRENEIQDNLHFRLDKMHQSPSIFVGLNNVPFYNLGPTVERIEAALGYTPRDKTITSIDDLPTRLHHKTYWGDQVWDVMRNPATINKQLLPRPNHMLKPQITLRVLEPVAGTARVREHISSAQTEITQGSALDYPMQLNAHPNISMGATGRSQDPQFINNRIVDPEGVMVFWPLIGASSMSDPMIIASANLFLDTLAKTMKGDGSQPSFDPAKVRIVRTHDANRRGSNKVGMLIPVEGNASIEDKAQMVASALGGQTVIPYGNFEKLEQDRLAAAWRRDTSFSHSIF